MNAINSIPLHRAVFSLACRAGYAAAPPRRVPATLTGVTAKALSVVMPVFNEATWVRTSLEALRVAAQAADLELDVVVVDDGSTDGTPAALAELADSNGIRVVTQANAGRLAARSAGVAQATEQVIMLLDSRVVVEPDTLRWLRTQLAEHPERRVWNGHVDVETRRNRFAAFWSGLVKIGWRRYTANPRLTSFGADEFDYFPKGTTCLVIPRDLLIEAVGGFESLFDNHTLSSDDTRLLRYVAARERIWISPDFAFRYHGKTGLKKFARQSYFRGTTFVDGYLGQAGHVRRALIAAMLGAVALAALFVFAPLVALGCVVAGLIAVPAVVRLVGGSWYEVLAAAVLTPLFIPIFGWGVLRGLALAASRSLRAARGTVRGARGGTPRPG
jgi:glycosyltransferase involved in cell wall biosynthesis